MSDNYGAVYDAVRSKISNGNIGDAIESALRNANLSHYADMASRAAQEAAGEQMRPCVVFKAVLANSGAGDTAWSATFGDLIAYGPNPQMAMWNFDIAWSKKP